MRAVLLLGSNLGDRNSNIQRAFEAIEKEAGRVVISSKIYESAAWGFCSDNAFLNKALVVETELSPIALLDVIQSIELKMGRVRKKMVGDRRVYSSRTIDIDILFYDNLILESERLTIPHPLICEREFVLTPLKEILGDFFHPVIGKIIREL